MQIQFEAAAAAEHERHESAVKMKLSSRTRAPRELKQRYLKHAIAN